MSTQKYKGIITALSISLILGITAPQSAIADNLPADTTYSESINKYFNLEFIPADEKYRALLIEPAGTSLRSGAKYKSWLKRTNASMSKISAALTKLTALPSGPSYSKSDPQLKIYVEAHSKYLAAVKKSLAKKKAVKADQPILQALADEISKQGDAWNALYAEEFAASNFSAPTTTPNITFTAADDPAGGKILYANLSDNASFDQQALRITSYDVEWYVGSTTSTSYPISGDITSVKAGTPVIFEFTGAVAGGLYFFRIKAVNSAGKGPWSTFFQTTITS
ncbi:Fibronectin type III [actinobacterium SCGC AAA044-D11]